MSKDIRRGIINTIVQNGGTRISGFFGHSYSDIARKFNVSWQSPKNVSKKIGCQGRNCSSRQEGGSKSRLLLGVEDTLDVKQ